jgi:hypothetical protein
VLNVDDYARIRLADRDGMSIREIAPTFGHWRAKIHQVLQEAEPKPCALSPPNQASLCHRVPARHPRDPLPAQKTTQGRDVIKEAGVRPVVKTLDWNKQRQMWRDLKQMSLIAKLTESRRGGLDGTEATMELILIATVQGPLPP